MNEPTIEEIAEGKPKTNLQIAAKAAHNILCTGHTSPNKNEPPGYKGRATIAIISAAIDEATIVQTIEIKRLNRCRDAHHEEIERLKLILSNLYENIGLAKANLLTGHTHEVGEFLQQIINHGEPQEKT